MSSPANKLYAAPALDKGLDMLETLAEAGVPLSQGEIAASLGRSPNEIYRMLSRLEARQYVLRDGVSGKYRLTLKLFQMARTHSPVPQLREAALEPMRRLAERTRQSCHLSVLDRGKLLVVLQIPGPQPVSLSVAEGSVFPRLQTSSGRLLLGSLPSEQRRAELQSDEDFQALTPAKRKTCEKELQGLAAQGYLCEESRLSRGISDVAVRIGPAGGVILAALTVSCVSGFAAGHNDDALLEEARTCSEEITTRLGLL